MKHKCESCTIVDAIAYVTDDTYEDFWMCQVCLLGYLKHKDEMLESFRTEAQRLKKALNDLHNGRKE